MAAKVGVSGCVTETPLWQQFAAFRAELQLQQDLGNHFVGQACTPL
jgi:hypothetical protein